MKKIIIAILAGVVVLSAAAAGYLIFVKKDSLFSKTDKSSPQSTQKSTSGPNEFAPVSTDSVSTIATITTTTKSGKKSVITMKFDGKGNSEYEIPSGGTTTKIVYTKDAYYSCSKDQCMKFAVQAGQSTDVDPAAYQMTTEEIAAAKNGAVYEGQKPCPGGTCDVWNVSGFNAGGNKAMVYIDSQTNKVVQIDSESIDGSKVVMVYEYGPVTIDIPQNARELPSAI